MKSVISLRNVTKKYGSKAALENVSLEVPSGVVFALLGENGAGKTTMIRILTGSLKPDSGTASVLGLNCVADGQQIRRQAGYVSDTPAMYEWMTAEEIGWFTSAFYDDEFPRRYNEAIAGFDIPRGVKIKSMSKGQRAKVALSLAVSHDPELLILDEPTSGLDPIVRRQFLESMVDRAALGRTVLLSSHHINEVERVADWVAIIHQGQVKLIQPLETLRDATTVVTATLDHADSTVAVPPGRVLSESKSGRQIRWVVSDLAENWRAAFGEDSGVTKISDEKPSLEEIFVAVCDPNSAVPDIGQPDVEEPGPDVTSDPWRSEVMDPSTTTP
ncbi:MAG: ABC transporter ATP-binding protein [Planctomycetota bacterium]